jgi:CelD/BcsL family acetyltransferase involved in cellulose biosynthesis
VKVDLYTTSAVFDILANEWDAVLDPDSSDNFFMRLDWQRIWWKHLGQGALSVMAIRDDDQTLRGIAPWFIVEEKHQRVMRIVGCVDVSDYIDLILAPNHEERVLTTLLDSILSNETSTWDIMHICNIPDNSPTLTLLPSLAAKRGLKSEIAHEDVCPIITLTGSYEDYLNSLDKKQRHELRRKRRRAEDHPVEWYIVGRERDLDSEIEAFLDLMAMSTPQKRDFLEQPGHRNFFREMGRVLFRAGLLEINFLNVGGQRAATMWNFVYRDRMMLYNSGLNPLDYSGVSAGIVLLTFSIEDAAKRGYHLFDFLQGDEEYKYRMGALPTPVHRLTIWR